MIDSPILKYNGGKFRLKDWIIPYFPNHKVYVEPFFGAGSVFFSKPRASMEIINDIDFLVTNFFSVLRDDSKELIRLLKNTPYAESTMKECLAICKDSLPVEPIKLAWAFYCVCWMNIRANDIHSTSFRDKGNLSKHGGHNPARLFAKLSHLISARDRLRGVTISEMKVLDCIETYQGPETLFYLDPPYLVRTRPTVNLYNNEMGSLESHRELLEKVIQSKGMFVISHYEDPLYFEILNGWECVKKETLSNNMVKGATKEDKARIECLYLSPNVSEKIHGSLFPGMA